MYRGIGLLPAPSAWSVTHDPFEDCREMRLRLKSNTQGDVYEGIRKPEVLTAYETGFKTEFLDQIRPSTPRRWCAADAHAKVHFDNLCGKLESHARAHR